MLAAYVRLLVDFLMGALVSVVHLIIAGAGAELEVQPLQSSPQNLYVASVPMSQIICCIHCDMFSPTPSSPSDCLFRCQTLLPH